VKFGISFTTRYLNQGNALVHVGRDGSVQVSTGATEMGQGVNTRIAMLVAEVFEIPVHQVRVLATSTDRNTNTSPTAASSGTDLNGTAAVMASKRIRDRLAELASLNYKKPREKWATRTAGLGTEPEVELIGKIQNEKIQNEASYLHGFSLAELANEAYLNRISLSEYSHYSVPGLGFNKLTGQGKAFHYFTQGVAATEVSIDRMSGEVKVLRTDILMDLGRPIHEGLDIGQVTGAFVQGMGWMTTENLYYKEGMLLSHSPSTYKIPSIQDTPRVFQVDLIENLKNVENIRGTKAVGEPPLLLAISVWTAIGNAIASKTGKFPNLTIPATAERVLRALEPERFVE
jgi:xanthine dehydrogenase large subunit